MGSPDDPPPQQLREKEKAEMCVPKELDAEDLASRANLEFPTASISTHPSEPQQLSGGPVNSTPAELSSSQGTIASQSPTRFGDVFGYVLLTIFVALGLAIVTQSRPVVIVLFILMVIAGVLLTTRWDRIASSRRSQCLGWTAMIFCIGGVAYATFGPKSSSTILQIDETVKLRPLSALPDSLTTRYLPVEFTTYQTIVKAFPDSQWQAIIRPADLEIRLQNTGAQTWNDFKLTLGIQYLRYPKSGTSAERIVSKPVIEPDLVIADCVTTPSVPPKRFSCQKAIAVGSSITFQIVNATDADAIVTFPKFATVREEASESMINVPVVVSGTNFEQINRTLTLPPSGRLQHY